MKTYIKTITTLSLSALMAGSAFAAAATYSASLDSDTNVLTVTVGGANYTHEFSSSPTIQTGTSALNPSASSTAAVSYDDYYFLGVQGTSTTTQSALWNQNTIGLYFSGAFVGNKSETAIYSAGAIFIGSGAKKVVIEGLFVSNSATSTSASYQAGAIYNNGGSVTSINADFIGNYSATTGGAIGNIGSIGEITGSFIGNSATTGGAIYNSSTITTLSANFTNNTASANGGAIWNNSTISSISGNFINNKSTSGSGGAIFNNGGTLSSVSGTFIGNSASQGGAIFNTTAGEITITASTADTVFTGNTASGSSNAIVNNGTITFSSSNGYKIILNDAITASNSQSYTALTISAGTTAFNNTVSGQNGGIEVDSGATLELGSYAGTSDLFGDGTGTVAASSADIQSALTVNGTLSLVVSSSKSDLVNDIKISSLTLDTGSSVALDLSEVFGSFDLSVSYFADLLAYFDSDFESSLLTVIFADSSFSSSISEESYTAGDGETYTYVVKDSTGEEILAAFNVDNTTTSGTITISGFSNVAVPEPSTYAMIIGALALGFAYYRRRK